MAIIGIDLGTTNSLVSVWKDGRVQLIPNAFGEYLTPSVVSFGDDGEVYVGKIAKEMQITKPERTFSEFKRHMGTDKLFYAGGKGYRAEELSSFVLRRLKEDAERFLGEPVTEAVVSVPAYFNDDKRCATRDAGLLADLKVEQLVNEPSAVALKHHIGTGEMEKFIILDLGGGTLDVSLVDAFDNVVEIQSVAGDNYLGGKDFNELIAEEFYNRNGLKKNTLSGEEQGIVLRQAELLKIELSSENSAVRTFLLGDKEYTMELTNQELIHLSVNLFKRMTQPIRKVMVDGNVDWDMIDKVILVGGSSKMPTVAKYIASICKTEVVADDSPDESIALGVGIAAAIRMRTTEIKDIVLTDVCPFSLGTSVVGGFFSPIIERNSKLPCSKTHTYNTVNDGQRRVTFRIFQGESMMAEDNLLLGEMNIEGLPPAPAGEVEFQVTFMYDIDGILDIRIKSGVQSLHRSILSKNVRLNREELDKRLEQLREMTLHPAEKEENRLLLERAMRLYQECSPIFRQAVMSYYCSFSERLEHGNSREIREAYVRTMLGLNSIEQQVSQEDDEEFDESFWEED